MRGGRGILTVLNRLPTAAEDGGWLAIRITKPERERKEEGEKGKLPDILTSVFKYINDNLQEDLSLASLEKKFFINRSHLGRLCRKHIGISLHRYIILQRIAKAKTLLSAGKSAMDACKDAGFNDYSNFRKMFKKVTNLTPSAYAKINFPDKIGFKKPRNYP